MARHGDAVFGAVPLAGNRGTPGARRLAVHDAAVADDLAIYRATDLPARHPLPASWHFGSADGGVAASAVADFTLSVVRGGRTDDLDAYDAVARSPSRSNPPAARRGGRRSTAVAREPGDRLAAGGGAYRGRDRAVRGDLCGVPAAGSEGIVSSVFSITYLLTCFAVRGAKLVASV